MSCELSVRIKLVYVPLDDERLTLLAQPSEATGRTAEELVQAAVNEFLKEKRDRRNRF